MTSKALRLAQPSARQLLTRLLDDPSLMATVQSLEPRSLGKLIHHVGLEDCGEIVSLATTEQIKLVFDDDLWKSERPGKDEAFDAERFGLWLEVMLEAGEDFVAQKLTELPEDLVTFALYRHILVVNIDELRTEMDGGGDDVDMTDKALESCLYQEINEYQVISRRHEGWDTIVAILLALDKVDHALLEQILDRCCHMSREYIEDNGGLSDVLSSAEMLEDDVAGEREERRAREGFLAPSQASSFLKLARTTDPQEVMAKERDAVTRAYFRELAPAKSEAGRPARQLTAADAAATSATEIEAMIGELDAAEMSRDIRPLFLLEAKARKGEGAVSLFSQALSTLAVEEPKAHAQRLDELAYLCNVLVSGCAIEGRPFRPVEAVVAVAAACNLGLDHLLKEGGNGNPAKTNAERAVRAIADGADKIFRVGLRILHVDVAMAACDAVAVALIERSKKSSRAEARAQMDAVTRSARAASAAQKPWQLCVPLEGLDGAFHEDTTEALLALLGEYPFLARKLSSIGSGRYRIDRHHQLIATEAEVDRVRAFLRGL